MTKPSGASSGGAGVDRSNGGSGLAASPDALALAVEHFKAGRMEEAHALAGRHEIDNAIGTELAKQGDLDGAERCFRAAIARAPGFFRPRNNLGNVLAGRGQLALAIEAYREALAIEPSAQRVHGNLGNTLLELGRPVDAADAYRRALALEASPGVTLRLAQALEATGDVDEALAAYGRAADMGEPSAAAKRADLAAAIGRHGPFGREAPAGRTAGADKLGRRRLVDATGEELTALFAPVSREEVVREIWARRPLFVKGFADKYRGFFDWRAFLGAVDAAGAGPEKHLRASFDKLRDRAAGHAGAPESVTDAFDITAAQSGRLFEAGATICMTGVEARVPRLAPFLDAVKRQLGYPGELGLNAYASPAGAGFNWHFDGRIATTLQIEGSKRWRFSRQAAMVWPRGNGVRRTDGSAAYTDPTLRRGAWERLDPLDEGDVVSVVLEPGDLLMLPAGTWHDACGGPTGSLALNLTFLPVSHTRLVAELLDRSFESDAAWRGATPHLPGPGGQGETGGLDAFREQLRRAADALRAVADDPGSLPERWAWLVENVVAPSRGPKGG